MLGEPRLSFLLGTGFGVRGQPRRSHGRKRRWSAGSARKTIHGTNTTVNTSVRSARGQWAIFGPTSHTRRVSDG